MDTLVATTVDVFIQKGFGRWKQRELFDDPHCALIRRVKCADTLDLVTEKIEPEGMTLARRIEIDKTSADSELPGVCDGVAADIAVCLKQVCQLIAINPHTRLEIGRKLTNSKRRQRALRDRVDRRDDQLSPGSGPLEGSEAGESLRSHP